MADVKNVFHGESLNYLRKYVVPIAGVCLALLLFILGEGVPLFSFLFCFVALFMGIGSLMFWMVFMMVIEENSRRIYKKKMPPITLKSYFIAFVANVLIFAVCYLYISQLKLIPLWRISLVAITVTTSIRYSAYILVGKKEIELLQKFIEGTLSFMFLVGVILSFLLGGYEGGHRLGEAMRPFILSHYVMILILTGILLILTSGEVVVHRLCVSWKNNK